MNRGHENIYRTNLKPGPSYFRENTYGISVLDTGDHYMIAFENVVFNKGIVKRVISLYEEMDVSIEHVDLEIVVPYDIKEFIRSICGRVIPYMSQHIIIQSGSSNASPDFGNVLDKLKVDIAKIIDFHQVKKFWSNYSNDTFKLDDEIILNKTTTESLSNLDGYDEMGMYATVDDVYTRHILPMEVLNFGTTVSSKSLILNDKKEIVKKDSVNLDKDLKSYVLFNSIYNISLFIENAEGIQEMCEEFHEFEIIETFDSKVGPDVISNCGKFFHKKTFATKKELVEKIKAYKNLYDVNAKEDNGMGPTENEKDRVFRFMNNLYEINHDPSMKMGATELYNSVINHLCISYQDRGTFKKRLAGYFIELGLTRKRFADGYFYYGIRVKYHENNKERVSVQDLLVKRAEEKKEWIKPEFGSKPSDKDWNDIRNLQPPLTT